MGSKGQRLVRPIDGGDEAKLEMKGFSYKNIDSSYYYFKVIADGHFNFKGINLYNQIPRKYDKSTK